MKFVAIGVNYISANVEFREKLAIGENEQKQALESFFDEFGSECVILSTCNRVEVYSYGDLDLDQITKWLSSYSQVNLYELCKHSYILQNEQVIEHLFRVVCGLDSMVLGESEILGQAKKAYRFAIENGFANKHLNKLFQNAFNLAKQARSETEIGKHSMSVMSTTLILIKELFQDLTDKKVILVGSGKMIQLGACYLAKEKPKELIISNRRIFKINTLAKNSNAKATDLSQIDDDLIDADILITSTASPGFLISSQQLLKNLSQRDKPFVAVDLSVPRDIEITDELKNHPLFFSYKIDDLQEVIQENIGTRLQSAKQVEEYIEAKVNELNRWYANLSIETALNQARKKQEKISRELVNRAKKELIKGKNPDEVLEKLAHQISQKTLHLPLKKAKELATDEKRINLVKQIFSYD